MRWVFMLAFKEGWEILKRGSIPNNEVSLAQKIHSEFGVDTWYDDGSVGTKGKISRELEEKIRSKYSGTRVGDGVQEGSIWVNDNDI